MYVTRIELTWYSSTLVKKVSTKSPWLQLCNTCQSPQKPSHLMTTGVKVVVVVVVVVVVAVVVVAVVVMVVVVVVVVVVVAFCKKHRILSLFNEP